MKQERVDKVNTLKGLLYSGKVDCQLISNKYGDDVLEFIKDNQKLYFNMSNIYDLLKRYTGTNDVILTPSEYEGEQPENVETCKVTLNDGTKLEI